MRSNPDSAEIAIYAITPCLSLNLTTSSLLSSEEGIPSETWHGPAENATGTKASGFYRRFDMVPVLVLTKNNLALTKECVKSALSQDIPVLCWVIDNDSSDGTQQWLRSKKDINYTILSPEKSVAGAWNFGLKHAFEESDAVCVINNDAVMRPDTVRHLAADGGGFVTAVGSDDPEKIKPQDMVLAHLNEGSYRTGQIFTVASQKEQLVYPAPDPSKKRPHPDFSCYLIRREVYEKVGPFDEKFEGAFGEDWDYHCRLHKAGITAMSLDLPFLHWGSMTVKNAAPADQKRIQMQADKNREYFKQKWGMAGGSPEYYSFFNSTAP